MKAHIDLTGNEGHNTRKSSLLRIRFWVSQAMSRQRATRLSAISSSAFNTMAAISAAWYGCWAEYLVCVVQQDI